VTLYTGALMLIMGVTFTIRGTFWSVLVAEELRIPAEHLALYPFARSVTMMLFFFFGMPYLLRVVHLTALGESALMIVGFIGFVASQTILVVVPVGSYGWLLVATILEGVSVPLTSTMLDKLTVVTVDAKERARTMAWLHVGVLVVSSPFGLLAGQLSTLNRRYPFVLVIGLFIVGGFVTYAAGRAAQRRDAAASAAVSVEV